MSCSFDNVFGTNDYLVVCVEAIISVIYFYIFWHYFFFFEADLFPSLADNSLTLWNYRNRF